MNHDSSIFTHHLSDTNITIYHLPNEITKLSRRLQECFRSWTSASRTTAAAATRCCGTRRSSCPRSCSSRSRRSTGATSRSRCASTSPRGSRRTSHRRCPSTRMTQVSNSMVNNTLNMVYNGLREKISPGLPLKSHNKTSHGR